MFALSVSSIYLLLFHGYLISNNLTTIDSEDENSKDEYNLGSFYENAKFVLGSNWIRFNFEIFASKALIYIFITHI